ncbi:fimbrial protein [Yersinia intermedia]|jgi:type 1 fimbria pilin|uniref:fimbrial protein n=2 Tax=Yersinia intermedia TaxID=631 RepID=UPI001CFD9C8B|nr:fimbrial protein [Yersinia intermedia]
MYQTARMSPRFLSAVACMGLLLGFAINAQAGSTGTTINFAATLVGGTCQIAVDRTTIPFDPVSSSEVIREGVNGIAPQLLTLSFSDCSGWGLTPKIQVSGTTITSGIPLFRNDNAASDYSQGYGVKLVQQGQTTAIANLDKLTVGTANTQISALNSQPLTFEARLSCGSCTSGPGLKGGNLNATVTFQFIYE